MSIFSFPFTEVMVFIYLYAYIHITVILCPFSAKTFIKYFSRQMCSARDKNPLNNPKSMFGQMLECGFICMFVIAGLRYTAKS